MRHEIQALLQQRTVLVEDSLVTDIPLRWRLVKNGRAYYSFSWMQLYAWRRRTSTPEGPRRCAALQYSWLVKHNRKRLPGGFKGQR